MSQSRSKSKNPFLAPDTATIYFSMFFAWMLAVPFLGQVLSARMLELQIFASPTQTSITLVAQFSGLVAAGYFVKTSTAIRRMIITTIGACMLLTLVFLLPYSFMWDILMIVLPFAGGLVVACWGYYYQSYSTPSQKLQVAANIIILSNIGMILLNVIAVNLSASLSISISVIMLLWSMVLCIRQKPFDEFVGGKRAENPGVIKENRQPEIAELPKTNAQMVTLYRSLGLLYVFIALITIDSGLMYQVVTPAFAHLELLTSIYWAIPYIGAIFILKRLPERVNKSFILYIAVTMIGLAYILFYILNNSAASYIVVDTIMLGAFGICDLFWWVILGEMLVFTNRPVKIFGIGLSANILGLLLGEMIGTFLHSSSLGRINPTTVAVGIVFISLIVLPVLYNNLSRLIKNQTFLMGLSRYTADRPPEESGKAETEFMRSLDFTGREIEIAELLLKGRTYKMISKELCISENTVKTHIKNIYSKLNVTSKTEFMMKITH